jgi:hypothetical protein
VTEKVEWIPLLVLLENYGKIVSAIKDMRAKKIKENDIPRLVINLYNYGLPKSGDNLLAARLKQNGLDPRIIINKDENAGAYLRLIFKYDLKLSPAQINALTTFYEELGRWLLGDCAGAENGDSLSKAINSTDPIFHGIFNERMNSVLLEIIQKYSQKKDLSGFALGALGEGVGQGFAGGHSPGGDGEPGGQGDRRGRRARLEIRLAGLSEPARSMSGGNQQKVVLANTPASPNEPNEPGFFGTMYQMGRKTALASGRAQSALRYRQAADQSSSATTARARAPAKVPDS